MSWRPRRSGSTWASRGGSPPFNVVKTYKNTRAAAAGIEVPDA